MFSVAFTLIFLTSIAIFAFVAYAIFRQRKTINKIFNAAEREIDRALNDDGPALATCGHCGSRVPAGKDCPQCGAPST